MRRKNSRSKHCSVLGPNNLSTPGAGFAVDTNAATVLKPGATPDEPIIEHWNKMGKQEFAGTHTHRIVGIAQHRQHNSAQIVNIRKYQPQSQAIASMP